MIRCDKCNARAVIFQRYSGMHLCREHFDGDVQRKVREVLRKTGVFGKGVKLAVALEGEKSSSVMLYIIKRLFHNRRDIEMVALLVDEGISGYRPEALAHARSLAERLSVPHITRSFKEVYQITMDDLARDDRSKSPCPRCAQMRKDLLNSAALDLGADVLAVGNNLDREAQEIMIGFIRGDGNEILGLQPEPPQQKKIPLIKPLQRVPGREVALYAAAHGLSKHIPGGCPYLCDPLRTEVGKSLSKFEGKHPGTDYSLLRSKERIDRLKALI